MDLFRSYFVYLWFCQVTFSQTLSCERLKRSLTYTQEDAPRDMSSVLTEVMDQLNQVLDGVVDVDIDYHGDDLQGRVGEHLVKCHVTRLASAVSSDVSDQTFIDESGRQAVKQCFEFPFTILDTNECQLPLHHPMRHKCQAPALCVNLNGSYDCLCPRMNSSGSHPSGTVDEKFWNELLEENRSPWELSYNSSSRSSCPSMASTHGCCSPRTNTREAVKCRENFRCPSNPCQAANTCASSATCVREPNPNGAKAYECQCPDGLMGNGHKCGPGDPKPLPKVRFDGVTPTEETIKNNFYCDCTMPVVDACSGFPPCKGKHEMCVVTASNVPKCDCIDGYVMHEKYGCVDESPPVMKLKNDPDGDLTLRLRQGDLYKEHAVDIIDENAEEYMRSLKITYSQPLPRGCLSNVGKFEVNYTIATPWTTPSFVRLTRTVVIDDIDECKLDISWFENECPSLIPKCDKDVGAQCVNKYGTYTCKCPQYTSGDGFLSGLEFAENNQPPGFQGGTGCRDTSKPIIELRGPNPKVFRISQCGALRGIMNSRSNDHDVELKAAQQRYYGDDIKLMIRQTGGAELCATHGLLMPNASDCVAAHDLTYTGKVDLSRDVVVGDPIQTSMFQWRVPYDVHDAAGNKADTVWRDVIIEELDIASLEAKVRSEALQQKDIEIRNAVEKAVMEERTKISGTVSVQKVECPTCPACNCEFDRQASAFETSTCNADCDAREISQAVRFVMWLEGKVPGPAVNSAIFIFSLFAAFLVFRVLWALLFPFQIQEPEYNAEERERGLQGHITEYIPGQQLIQNGQILHSASTGLAQTADNSYIRPLTSNGPPVASYSINPDEQSIFTPSRIWAQPSVMSSASPNGATRQQQLQASMEYDATSIITPSRNGDGVRRRSPYSG